MDARDGPTSIDLGNLGGQAEAAAAAADDESPPTVPGYALIRVIGRGGMGVVWEATEHRLDRRVALKVRRGFVDGEDVLHLWSEARLAARVADPGVVAVHDIGTTLDGRPYYTMDLVDGTDLRAVLREGALAQTRALTIGAQIAHAVAAAHERGIAHRDLKPANIVIDLQGRARVLDFGVARATAAAVDQLEKYVFGTPSYMSPEQVLAEPVGPAADIHAIGILLYEMLTGARPFTGADTNAIMASVATDAPAPPTSRVPGLHVDVERVVLRCLEKKPDARFGSARKLANALDALLEGRPLPSLSVPPVAPQARRATTAPPPRAAERESAKVHQRWSWQLRSSPDKLWPLVANTERVNRAIGLPEVEYTDVPDGEGASKRTATARVLGMDMAWREFPFEWVKNREHSVYREYAKGPLEAMWNRVELSPAKEGGGSELVHEVWLAPRNVIGRIAASWDLSQRIGKNLDELYRRIDATLVSGLEGPRSDAFEPPFEASATQHAAAENEGRELVARGFDAAMVRLLLDHLLYQPTKVLERLRPYALAEEWKVDPGELLTLFLHAANRGLVDLSWDLICPRCLASHESFQALAKVERLGACVPCNRAYERDLRESIEVVFRPHPALREAKPTMYCAGAPALRPHVFMQQFLSPGDDRLLEVDLPPGDYKVVASRVLPPFEFAVSRAAVGSDLEVTIHDGHVEARPGIVRAGPVRVAWVNGTAHEHTVRIEAATATARRVTAADILTSPEFHDMFSDEMLAEGEHMTVSRMAFVFVEIDGRAGLLARLGDAGAWAVLRRLDAVVGESIRAQHGTDVPASLDARIASFSRADAAVRAALAICRGAADIGESVHASVHDGQCIALTRAGRTEYFGKTLHRGMALLADARAGGVAISAGVAADRAVVEALTSAGVTQEVFASQGEHYKGTRVVRLLVPRGSKGPDSVTEPEFAVDLD
jgi:serine/threonine protein kinase